MDVLIGKQGRRLATGKGEGQSPLNYVEIDIQCFEFAVNPCSPRIPTFLYEVHNHYKEGR